MVEAAVLTRPLDGDQVDRLFDDADERVVAPGVAADGADLFLSQVPALAAEANAFLHVLDRRSQRERFVLRPLQQVECEPVRRARPHAG